MRIPLTKYGLPQVLVFPALILGVMAVYLGVGIAYLPAWGIAGGEVVLGAVLVFVLAFFRDPERVVDCGGDLMVAPADGQVADIAVVDDEFIGGRALRIGIFLSIFNTHINRAPCDVRVEGISYTPGKFLDARDKRAGKVNEANEVRMVRTGQPRDRLIVRQISGAIARRIVCAAREGQELAGGEQFGMIKFGSRTELYVPIRDDVKCLVKEGDKVKAGLTNLVRYELWGD